MSLCKSGGFDRRLGGFYFAYLIESCVPLQQGIPNPTVQLKKCFAMLPLTDLFTLFVSGGPVGMIIITLLFIALFFAAWKAPAWVKEIGIAALVVGIFWTLSGFLQMADFLAGHDDVAPNIIAGGFKVGLVPVLYGLIVYFVSLILRVIHKPRI